MIRKLLIALLGVGALFVSFKLFSSRPRPDLEKGRIYPYSRSRWD